MTLNIKDARQRRFEELPAATPETVSELPDDHYAMVQRTPIFQKSVVSAKDSPRVFVSGQNNKKIGRVVTKGAWIGMPIYVLTLPERTTCPTACHMYRSCYGNAMPFARRHAPGEDLEEAVETELAGLAKQHPKGFVVRLHVLGDFYSPDYVKLWRRMLAEHESLHIYGYTAVGEASDDLSVSVAAEIEGINEAYPDQAFIRWSSREHGPGATVVIDYDPKSKTVDGGIVCPAEREATACCATCGMCWEKSAREKTIVFLRHGMGSRKNDKHAERANEVDGQGLRKISPLPELAKLSGVVANVPPTMIWVNPSDLHVDSAYQRNLSGKSMRLISRIVSGWNWTHFKPPIVTKDAETGALFVLDGQHTAIAAASHTKIDKIPIMIVEAHEISDRAKAFLGHNRDRIAVTPLQLHHSALVANDTEAMQIQNVCDQAGIVILRNPPSNGVFGEGQTVALGGVRFLINRCGPAKAVFVLSCLAAAGRTPIRGDEMRAIAYLMDQRSLDRADVVAALKAIPYERAILSARDIASAASIPVAEALAAVFSREMD